jgi:hypothetical protein
MLKVFQVPKLKMANRGSTLIESSPLVRRRGFKFRRRRPAVKRRKRISKPKFQTTVRKKASHSSLQTAIERWERPPKFRPLFHRRVADVDAGADVSRGRRCDDVSDVFVWRLLPSIVTGCLFVFQGLKTFHRFIIILTWSNNLGRACAKNKISIRYRRTI